MSGPPDPRSFTSGYVPRVIDGELDRLLPALPAIFLDGPKGVGKTSTCLQRAATVRRLDKPAQRAIAEADPDAALAGDTPVLLDEWQRVPAVWDAVKRHVDSDLRGGRFLLTGSAAPHATTHSGAGRITSLRMRPLTLPERGTASPCVSLGDLLKGDRPPLRGSSPVTLPDYADEIVRSGLPGLRHLDGAALRTQLDSYIDHIVTRDMEDAGHSVRRPAAVLGWLRAYAAATATPTSYEKIRDAATSGVADKPAKTSTLPYIDALTNLRILDPVPAWIPSLNHLRRLTQAPKHHLVDPALAARLLGLGRDALMAGEAGTVELPRDGTFLGALFESLAVLSVRVFAQVAQARLHHLRTRAGVHEVDLIVERHDGRVLAIEVKLSSSVEDHDVRHLTWLRELIGARMLDGIVLTTGPQAYRRKDGIGVIPLTLLGA